MTEKTSFLIADILGKENTNNNNFLSTVRNSSSASSSSSSSSSSVVGPSQDHGRGLYHPDFSWTDNQPFTRASHLEQDASLRRNFSNGQNYCRKQVETSTKYCHLRGSGKFYLTPFSRRNNAKNWLRGILYV